LETNAGEEQPRMGTCWSKGGNLEVVDVTNRGEGQIEERPGRKGCRRQKRFRRKGDQGGRGREVRRTAERKRGVARKRWDEMRLSCRGRYNNGIIEGKGT